MNKILIVEDEENTLQGLVEILSEEGFKVTGVSDGESGLKEIQKNSFDLILSDLMLPGINGLEFIEEAHLYDNDLPVVIMTAHGTVRNAVKAMKKGVSDYLTKPIDIDELLLIIKKSLNEKALKKENKYLKAYIKDKYRFENIIGASGPILEVFEKVKKVAVTNSTILVRGESGTGKELIARAIHINSQRADNPFIEINCASLPDTLLESELFGHERGAFTGAIKTKKGRFELADSGTIFLDEIGEINSEVQIKLLRVLQEKVISRLGSTKGIKIDVRLIAATNRNLEKALKEGKFRDDLYYRLNVIPVFIPPLRDRTPDIPLLIEYFIQKFCKENNKENLKIPKEALDVCLNYKWPGNVRELENAIENAVVLCDDKTINPVDLPFYLRSYELSGEEFVPQADNDLDLNKQIEIAEKRIIEKALQKSNNNRTKAAKLLSVSLRTIRYKVKKYNL